MKSLHVFHTRIRAFCKSCIVILCSSSTYSQSLHRLLVHLRFFPSSSLELNLGTHPFPLAPLFTEKKNLLGGSFGITCTVFGPPPLALVVIRFRNKYSQNLFICPFLFALNATEIFFPLPADFQEILRKLDISSTVSKTSATSVEPSSLEDNT